MDRTSQAKLNGFQGEDFSLFGVSAPFWGAEIVPNHKQNYGGFFNMNVRNEIKAQIIRAGMTMQEVVDLLSDEYGWSDSVSNERRCQRLQETFRRTASCRRADHGKKLQTFCLGQQRSPQ